MPYPSCVKADERNAADSRYNVRKGNRAEEDEYGVQAEEGSVDVIGGSLDADGVEAGERLGSGSLGNISISAGGDRRGREDVRPR